MGISATKATNIASKMRSMGVPLKKFPPGTPSGRGIPDWSRLALVATAVAKEEA